MSEFLRPRRYYLQKRAVAALRADAGDAAFWTAKQQAQPGTALAVDFPHLTRLASAGYSTIEDLDGADTDELRRAGLTLRQAREALNALAEARAGA
jgi:hypothetical protein